MQASPSWDTEDEDDENEGGDEGGEGDDSDAQDEEEGHEDQEVEEAGEVPPELPEGLAPFSSTSEDALAPATGATTPAAELEDAEAAAAASAAEPLPIRTRVLLGAEERSEIAACALRLALQSQFSKNGDLARDSRLVLHQLAHLVPELVLPHVVQRMTRALDNVHAAQQLPWAIYTLANTVRPMLLYGLPAEVLLPPEQDSEGRSQRLPWELSEEPGSAAYPASAAGLQLDRGVAGQVVGQIMMALLPCIDASDESKTRAALKFYMTVLASIQRLPGPDVEGPSPLTGALDTEAWVSELISRLLALLEGLESGSASGLRATDEGTDRLGSRSRRDLSSRDLFGYFLMLLARRMPPSLKGPVAGRCADWLATSSCVGVTDECFALAKRLVTELDQEVAIRRFMLPVLQQLAEELEEAGSARVSGSLERLLVFKLQLVAAPLAGMSSADLVAVMRNHMPLLQGVIRRAFQCHSVAVINTAVSTLGTVFLALGMIRAAPLPEGVLPPEALQGTGIEAFLSPRAAPGIAEHPLPPWESVDARTRLSFYDTTAEERSLLETLLAGHTREPLAELEALAAGGSNALQLEQGLPIKFRIMGFLAR